MDAINPLIVLERHLGTDKDSEQKSCESFTAHPIRKHCKVCLKPWEDHHFTEDDVDNMKTHLKVFSEHPEINQHAVYAWTPPNCPEDRIDEYFQKFPEDKIPKHQSEGQKSRLRRLAYQIPLSDVSLEKCRFLDPKYQEDFEEYAQKVQNTILRIGQVKEMTQGMPIQCPKCLLVLEQDELVVASDNGSQAFHPACFVCFQCREILADLIHCCDTDGLVYCLRHYSENAKKRCHACDELIFSSKFALAGNKSYHKEHLLCFACDCSLEDAKGYTKNGELYCANCYETKFCTDCFKCQKKINVESRHISFRDNNWHEECFSCTKCDTKLADIPFELVDDDKFLCFECYQKYYAPKCEGCKECFEPQSQVVTYEENVYHVPCFKCVDCLYSIGTGPFVPHDGQVYCKSCHLRNFGVRCFRCKYAITDDSALMYNKEPYHNSCFTCCMCETRLSRRPFKTIEDKWYCFNCYGNTFCQKCHLCEEPIVLGSEEDVMFSYQNYRWHDSCFMCSLCCKSLADKPFTMNEKVLVCKQCIAKHEEREKEENEKEEREKEEREKLQKEKELKGKEISSAEDKEAEEISKSENKEE